MIPHLRKNANGPSLIFIFLMAVGTAITRLEAALLLRLSSWKQSMLGEARHGRQELVEFGRRLFHFRPDIYSLSYQYIAIYNISTKRSLFQLYMCYLHFRGGEGYEDDSEHMDCFSDCRGMFF